MTWLLRPTHLAYQDRLRTRARELGTELGWPEEVSRPMYWALAGGKGLRPLLLNWAYRAAVGRDNGWTELTVDAGLALEMVHAFSLIHDDLPAMDDDNFRRGRPTLHRLTTEGLAVLAGDALLIAAFEVLSVSPGDAAVRLGCIRELSRAAGASGMTGGQWRDLEGRADFARMDELLVTHRMKTGALFGAATAMGARLARLSDARVGSAREWGVQLGVWFQLVDDRLDDEVPEAHAREMEARCDKLCRELSANAPAWLTNAEELPALLHLLQTRVT